ncbi:MAG: DM13 domain-containing protein [Thiotrichales bacterium]|nr:MAG: DM13 domain-containing protein [Thiotrichales bacterium]
MRKLILLTVSHALVALAGFAAGIYALPILTAPEEPSASQIATAIENAEYEGRFRRDLAGSDFLHWGDGIVTVGRDYISLQGRIAPGPDYKLYLSPEFVETEKDFARARAGMKRVGDVKTFENFVVPVPDSIDITSYSTVIVWCESFGEFITAAEYR